MTLLTMGRLWLSAVIAGSLAATSTGEAITPKHEAGRCAIRGNCGRPNIFAPELPCPDNGLAKEPEDDVRKQLVDICGPKWNTGKVCCESEQVNLSCSTTKSTLLIMYSLILFPITSKRRMPSYQPALLARRTSIISSALSPALRTNLFL